MKLPIYIRVLQYLSRYIGYKQREINKELSFQDLAAQITCITRANLPAPNLETPPDIVVKEMLTPLNKEKALFNSDRRSRLLAFGMRDIAKVDPLVFKNSATMHS